MKLARALWWYLREVSGETAYDQYLARVRRDRPREPVMSRREFERHRAEGRGHCC